MTYGHGYEEAKELARRGDAVERAQVAARTDLPPELLYFLAQDPDDAVRCAVAANGATPPQANTLLTRDPSYAVRCALAQKVVGEGLADTDRRNLWRMGFTILETLAVDQVVRVRKILSRALHSDSEAPHAVVLSLARDAEREVAAPVLERSPVLTDGDLIDIVEQGAVSWAQEAIAGRAAVSSELAAAIVKGDHPGAVKRLAANKGVQESPEARAARLQGEGKLSDEVVSLAMAAGERSFVTAALALRAGLNVRVGQRIVASKSAKAVTALAWKGKFPMRFALDVQRRLAGIAPAALLYARNGVDYPLTPKEMNWHLGLFAD